MSAHQELPARKSHFIAPDPDDYENPSTPPSSPIHGEQIQTNALLHQVIQRLVGMSLRTIETITTSLISTSDHDTDEDNEMKDNLSEDQFRAQSARTPPPSPTFDGLTAPTPNTAIRAIKSSTFLHVSSFNPLAKAFASRSPGEIPSIVNDFLRGYPSMNIK